MSADHIRKVYSSLGGASSPTACRWETRWVTCVRTDIRTYVHEGLCLHTCDTLDGKWSCGQVQCVHHEIPTGVLLYSVWASMYIMACVNIQRDVRMYIPQEHSNIPPIFVLQLLLAATKLSPCAVLLW